MEVSYGTQSWQKADKADIIGLWNYRHALLKLRALCSGLPSFDYRHIITETYHG